MSVTFTACLSNPPGLERRSRTKPLILIFSFWILFIDFIRPSSVCSVKEVILKYPMLS